MVTMENLTWGVIIFTSINIQSFYDRYLLLDVSEIPYLLVSGLKCQSNIVLLRIWIQFHSVHIFIISFYHVFITAGDGKVTGLFLL